MTKRKVLKGIVLALTIIAMAVICAVAIIGAEENKTYTVSYYTNGSVMKSYTYQSGEKHDVANKPFSTQTANKQFFGWYDDSGTFFEPMQITVNKNYNFYEAYGLIVKTTEDFVKAIKQGGTFIRLGASIRIEETVKLPSSGLAIIDLNGYNITIETEDVGFEAYSSGIHIMNTSKSGTGKISHTGIAQNADLMDASLFKINPTLRNNVSIHLFKNANIESNVGIFEIASDLTYSKYTYNFDIESSISGNFIVRTYGINNAIFKMYETAHVSVTGQCAFEDRGNCEGINLIFDMSCGKLDISENTFMTNDLSKIKVYLTGGNFNKSLSNLYKNYTFVSDGAGRFNFKSCAHDDILIGMTATCTEAGDVTYKCSLCGLVHTEASNAIGHTTVRQLVQEAITTKEVTEPGYYATTCQRCGLEEREYFYPDPKDVYVTVKLRMKDNSIKTIRVKSTDIFGDSVGERLQSFDTSYLQQQQGVEQSNIISIELPLGIKTIAGGYGGNDHTPLGLFYKNPHLEEIIIPMSVETIEAAAFCQIDTLKTVKGLEHVSKSIGEDAFKQNPSSELFIERLELNAQTIGANAFLNATMISLTFGENVKNIGASAFGLDEGKETKLLEIFIVGNESIAYNRATLSKYNEDFKRFSSLNSGHQFDNLGIVYVDHEFIIETTAPTCQEGGFDFKKCKFCGEEKIDNLKNPVPHNYVVIDPPVKSTCLTQGYEGTKCTMCDDVKVTKYYPFDPSTHDYTYDTMNSEENICEKDYYIIGVCRCGEMDPDRNNWKYTTATGKHVWDEQNPIDYLAPTCGQDGYTTVECSYCGFAVDIVHKATKKHTMVTDNKKTVPATCTTEGIMAWVCDVCGEAKERSVPENKDNHEWEKDKDGNLVWTVKVEPTPEKAGTAQNKCVGCGKTQTKGIPVTSEQTEGISKLVLILLIVGGSIIVLGGIGITLYFTLFKKSSSSGYKYKFNTLGKK